MKKRSKFFVLFLIFLGVIVILAFILLIPPVSNKVGSWVGKTGDTIRGIAQTVAGIVIGIMLITWGIAALEVPPLGVTMIIAGLGMLGWNVYPLFTSSSLNSNG